MRSVGVVLPASMWAMMPILRSFGSGVFLGIFSNRRRRAPTRVRTRESRPPVRSRPCPRPSPPPVVCEGLVGLSHPMRVFLLLDRRTPVPARRYQLVRESLRHRLLAALPRELDEPAH